MHQLDLQTHQCHHLTKNSPLQADAKTWPLCSKHFYYDELCYCSSVLCSIPTTHLNRNLEQLIQTDAVFTDFAKAFDRIPHNRLINEMKTININIKVIKWVGEYLHNKFQSVITKHGKSSPQPVKSGVPQGSVLGPTLFLIYNNDTASSITSSIRLFADDCVIYQSISNLTDCNMLQNDLSKLDSWCSEWKMTINTKKQQS